MNSQRLIFGIPKEILLDEKRVSAIPETVKKLTEKNAVVLIEKGAGEGAHFSDYDYEAAGAELVSDVEEIYRRADIILKVKEPIFNKEKGKHELDMMRKGQFLISFLHPANPGNHDMVKALAAKGVIALTLDSIPRVSRAQSMDALTSMSTVTGYKSVLIAANNLPKFIPMIGTALGSVKPAKCLVVGVGVVGLQAIATIKRLGGIVTAVDIRPKAREEAISLGAKVEGFEVPPELATGKYGYAKALPSEWLEKEREALTLLLEDVDVLIMSALVPGEVAPVLVTDKMVAKMKSGSVIVDVSIDQGGNCAITKAGKEIIKNGVIISGMQNIPARMPVHSTWLYANNIFNYVENLFKKGVGELDLEDEIVQNSLVTYQGKIVHEGTLKALGKAQ